MDKINKITTSKQTTMYDHLYKMIIHCCLNDHTFIQDDHRK